MTRANVDDDRSGEVVVVAAVIHSRGKFLVCQRPAHKHHGGLWEFPGGKVEPGEAVSVALARELKEELDLDLLDSTFLDSVSVSGEPPLLICFHTCSVRGEPQLFEHQNLAWVRGVDLSGLELAPADRIFSLTLL